MHRVTPLVAALLALSSCTGDPADRSAGAGGDGGVRASETARPGNLDASPRQLKVLALQVYALDLPRGRASDNAELWRRIDEQKLDPGTYDVLWTNGIRVGGAALEEMEHIRGVLGIETADRTDILGRGFGRQVKEFEIAANIGEKTLFWFDARKQHHGRTFQRCTMLMSVSFEPTPGTDDSVRIAMTPVVRSNDPRMIVTPAGNDYQVVEHRETNILDVSLRADVKIGEFLIVAPSDESDWEMSLGRQFFCKEREGGRFERVYVLIPAVTSARTAPRH